MDRIAILPAVAECINSLESRTDSLAMAQRASAGVEVVPGPVSTAGTSEKINGFDFTPEQKLAKAELRAIGQRALRKKLTTFKHLMVKPIEKLHIKIFGPGNKQKRVIIIGKAKHAFDEAGIESELERIANVIEVELPGHEYRLVDLGKGYFNFVWVQEPRIAILPEETAETISV